MRTRKQRVPFGDAQAWAPRIAKGKEALYATANNGLNGMPAKGMCVDCNEDELKAAVDYMTSHAKAQEKEKAAEKK